MIRPNPKIIVKADFQISDLHFSIKSATLSAYLSEAKIYWGFEVRGADNERFPQWAPLLSVDPFTSGRLDSWKNFAPCETSWNSPNDTDTIPNGMLYVFCHELLHSSRVSCFREQGELILEVDGRANLYFDSEYESDLEIRVKTPVEFAGIQCGRRSRPEALEHLAALLDVDEFTYFQDANGVSKMVPRSQANPP